jgi:penicillin-binding protein 1B
MPQLRFNSLKNHAQEILSTLGIILTLLAFTVFYRVENIFERMQNEIQEPQWKISSTLYADVPILNAGSRISPDWLIDYFLRLKYTEVEDSVVKPGQYTVKEEGIVFLKRGNASAQNNSPILVTFDKAKIQKMVQLKTGTEMPKVAMDPLPLADVHGSSYEKQKLLQLREVPAYALKAVVAIEDRRFYSHGGVDLRAIARAAWNNCFDSAKLQGGSTITQQVVKNFYLTPKKSLRRKMNEALMAIMMEKKYTKDKILEFYVNNVYLGKCGTYNVRGFQEASRLYFKKDARYLSVPEAALLAGMIQAPLRYNPYEYPEKAKSRRDTVLLAMRNIGVIGSEDYEKYVDVPIHVEPPDEEMARAPYFVNAVLKQLPEEYSSSQLRAGGYQINTTLDMNLQKTAEDSLAAGLAAIDKYRLKKNKEKVQGCLIAVEPRTGYVRAFVGGRNFHESQFDRVTQALRHPGSSFKPFVYAAALETAFDPAMPYYYTPSTLLDDEPLSMQLANGTWEPENYNHEYYGVVSARQALAYSMNVATARLAQQLGVNKISDLSTKAGLKNAKPYPSMALGAFEVTPWDLVQAYTIFANGGNRVEITGIRSVVNAKGQTIYQSHIAKAPIIHKETAYVITNMLQSVVTSGTAASLKGYGLTQPIAGKTGTSNDFRDAWFVGYTPDLLCLVWVGYDDNKPVKLTGAQAAIPIWANFMKKALAGTPARDFARPEQTVEREIDPTTGKLAGWDCIDRVREIFIKGTEPTEYCSDEDHYRSPESFLGPQSRSTPLMVQKTGGSFDNDLAYGEDDSASSDSTRESESNDGYYYIAAPENHSDDSKKIENQKRELSQDPSDTQEFHDLKSISNSDTERSPESDDYEQPTLDQQENTGNPENVQQLQNNDYEQLNHSNNESQQQSNGLKKKLRRPKNIDEPQEPQSQPEQN